MSSKQQQRWISLPGKTAEDADQHTTQVLEVEGSGLFMVVSGRGGCSMTWAPGLRYDKKTGRILPLNTIAEGGDFFGGDDE